MELPKTVRAEIARLDAQNEQNKGQVLDAFHAMSAEEMQNTVNSIFKADPYLVMRHCVINPNWVSNLISFAKIGVINSLEAYYRCIEYIGEGDDPPIEETPLIGPDLTE